MKHMGINMHSWSLLLVFESAYKNMNVYLCFTVYLSDFGLVARLSSGSSANKLSLDFTDGALLDCFEAADWLDLTLPLRDLSLSDQSSSCREEKLKFLHWYYQYLLFESKSNITSILNDPM